MSGTIKFSFSLPRSVYAVYEKLAEESGSQVRAVMRDVLHAHARDHLPPGTEEPTFDLALYRSLTDRVADMAERIVDEEGWCEDITARAVRACQQDAQWIADYRALIGDVDVFCEGNSIKTSVNQNFGQYVKVRLGARNKLDDKGNRVTQQVGGAVVKTVTLLVR